MIDNKTNMTNEEAAKWIVPWYMTEGDYYGAEIAPIRDEEEVAEFVERALGELSKSNLFVEHMEVSSRYADWGRG